VKTIESSVRHAKEELDALPWASAVIDGLAREISTFIVADLMTADEVAELWGVTPRRVTARLCHLEKQGRPIGRRFGRNAWALTPAEAMAARPGKTGRPKTIKGE